MKQLTFIFIVSLLSGLSAIGQNAFLSGIMGHESRDMTNVEEYHKWITAFNKENAAVRSRNNQTHKLDSIDIYLNQRYPGPVQREFKIEYFYSDTLEISISSECDMIACIRNGFALTQLDTLKRVVEIIGYDGWDDTDEVFSNHPKAWSENYSYNELGLLDSVIQVRYRNIDTSKLVSTHYYNEYKLLDSIRRNTVIYTSQDTSFSSGGINFFYDEEMNMILSESYTDLDNGSIAINRTVGYDHDETGPYYKPSAWCTSFGYSKF